MPTIVTHSELPFAFECPDGCRVIRKSNPLNAAEHSIVVTKQTPRFFLNLIWGPHSSQHATPPGFTLVEKRQLETPTGSQALLVARGPFLTPPFVFASVFWGLLIGLGSFIFLRQHIGLWGVLLAAGASALLFLAYFVVRSGPSVKCAFVVEGIEYVFTGSWRQRGELDVCLRSIRFS
ncbi:MAG: hypothetical protein Q8P24_20320 [Desulfobacterales bacterium]|nr:hypothetical protein [Desulfobacterales bacterium]